MFGTIGGMELLVIFLLCLLVFGPRKLPELGRAIGRSLAEFRRATQDLKNSIEREVDLKEADLRNDLKSVEIQRASPSPRASEPPTLPPPADDEKSQQS